MRKIKFAFALIISALCLTSCCERVDAGSEGILVNLYGSDKGIDDVSLVQAEYGTTRSPRKSMSTPHSCKQSTILLLPSMPKMVLNLLSIPQSL